MSHKSSLKYIFSKDTKQLTQYHRLRKIIYATDLGLDVAPIADDFDPVSHTLTVINRQRCVGGVRLTLHHHSPAKMLPMETEYFQLRYLLPELSLETSVYAEISRLILLPEFRDGEVTKRMYKEINRKCRQLGVNYLFAITPYAQARRYMLSSKQLGFSIKMADVKIPEEQQERYGGLAECLLVLSQEPSQLVILPAKPSRNLATITPFKQMCQQTTPVEL